MSNAIDISKRTKGEWKAKDSVFQNIFEIRIGKIKVGETGNYHPANFIPTNEAEANAAFIVTACNNYDKLVEALKECLRDMDVMNGNVPRGSYETNGYENAKKLLQSIEQDI